MHGRCYLCRIVGLWKKDGVGRNAAVLEPEVTGCDDDLNRWPAIPYSRRELQSVHCSWHVNVGKDDADIAASL